MFMDRAPLFQGYRATARRHFTMWDSVGSIPVGVNSPSIGR